MIGLTHDQLLALNPCALERLRVEILLGDAASWDGRIISAAEAVAAGISLKNLTWVAAAVARSNPDVERRLRLWLSDCAARVLHVYEDFAPQDMRVRGCIVAARAFARNPAEAAEAAEAAREAWAAWAARAAGEKWQFERLVEWLSDPEPQDWALPEIQQIKAA